MQLLQHVHRTTNSMLEDLDDLGDDCIGCMSMTSNLRRPSISVFWDWIKLSLSGIFNIWLCIKITSQLEFAIEGYYSFNTTSDTLIHHNIYHNNPLWLKNWFSTPERLPMSYVGLVFTAQIANQTPCRRCHMAQVQCWFVIAHSYGNCSARPLSGKYVILLI